MTGSVDIGDDASGTVERGLGSGPFRLGESGVAEEDGLGVVGVVGPDLPVLGMVGGLRAAGRVAQPHQRLVGVRGAGEFQAQGLARIREPAVVTDAEVQGLRLRLEDTLDAPVVNDGDRPGVVPLQDLVDGLEGGDEAAGALSAGQDAALVVLVGGDGQPQVFGFFLGGDFGGEGGLVSPGAG
ncbi:hypothetical protein [Streptomyces noursei]|uniref:hypothetical protein n=1 Tax=Streptomyces noursei TaxID=1971 RepID=UPI003804C4AA